MPAICLTVTRHFSTLANSKSVLTTIRVTLAKYYICKITVCSPLPQIAECTDYNCVTMRDWNVYLTTLHSSSLTTRFLQF